MAGTQRKQAPNSFGDTIARSIAKNTSSIAAGPLRSADAHFVSELLPSAPPHTGSPGPFGPGTPEESEKSPERVPRGRAPKVPKECAPESRKSPKRV